MHLHSPILSAILGGKMYTKELTPKMVGMVDALCAEVCSALCKGVTSVSTDWGRVISLPIYIN